MADCIAEIPYSEFSTGLHENLISKHIPLGGGIELTYRCNLRCAHCYIDVPCKYDNSQDHDELSKEEISNILDQAVSEGLLWLLITGGEPLIRKDFKEIYMDAKKKGLIVTIFTNGTLITPEMADFFYEWPPFAIEITLYGASKKVYESVTGIKGSYDKCMRAIDLLLERKLPLKLKSMILTLNKEELEDMETFAKEKGLSYRYDAMLNPSLTGFQSPAKVSLSPKEIVELDIMDTKRFQGWKKFVKKYNGPPKSNSVFRCGAGLQNFHMSPSGEMSVCILARKHRYDLRQGTFKEGWHEFILKVRAEKFCKGYPCEKCEIIDLCGQCPGWSYLEHGNQEKPVEYLCKIAHLRAEAIGLNRKIS